MVKFEKAFIQKQGQKLRIEEALVSEYVTQRGVAVEFYSEKEIHRRKLPLNLSTLVVGDMPCMFGAMRQLELEIPVSNPYPHALMNYMHRSVWIDTLGRLEHRLLEGSMDPIFAKPKSQHKKFTGRVFASADDLYFVYGATRKLELICSEVVKWVSEYRVYVVDSEIRKICHYDGDPEVLPSKSVIEAAIDDLYSAGEAYAGFGIDFGVLSTGETALIEMNDGFALGAYDVSSNDYGEMVWNRWAEIVESKSR